MSNRDAASLQAHSTNHDLYTVPIRGGSPTNLTASNHASDGDPQYSPDGRYIAFRRQEQPGYESDRFRLALYERATGKIRVMTEGFDTWVEDYAWSADSQFIVFRSPVAGRFPLFRMRVADGSVERIPTIPSVAAFDVSHTGTIAFVHSSVGVPWELYVAAGDGTGARKLTSLNQPVADRVDIRPVEEMWVPGADGVDVHVFVVKPHGYKPGKRYPLIINVHGGPQMQWADAFRGDWQVYPGAGYVLAFPEPTWIDRLRPSLHGGDLRGSCRQGVPRCNGGHGCAGEQALRRPDAYGGDGLVLWWVLHELVARSVPTGSKPWLR